MKFWFRINELDTDCSWSFVYNEIKKALIVEGHIVHPNIENPPKDIEDYVEMWWTDPRFWDWSKLPVKAKIGICLSESHSFITEGKSIAFKNLRQCDSLIIPTEFSATSYREAPIDVPIFIVPFGVNDNYKYIKRDWSNTINYLHYGVAQFRKGSWLAPEAFIKAFNYKDKVHLTISSFRQDPMYKQLESEYGKHPKITFSDKQAPTSLEIYSKHHILVSPHLSEGWGLCVPEAMSTGMCCLISRCSSPLEYFSTEYGWWIEMSDNYVPVSKCLQDTPGFWRLPSVDSLVEVMKESYHSRELCMLKGEKASEYILSNYTWQHTARKIVKVIDNVYDNMNLSNWK